jgi:YegS/Rv2252/BmrU family lipid kinase
MNETQAAPFENPSQLPRRAVLMVNTKSRRGQEWFAEAQSRMRDLGIEIEKAWAFRSIDELKAEAKSAIGRKVPLVVAGGGDGTFSAIARYFVKSESVLGVLPLGTGNAFARDLGIAAELDVATRTLVEGRVAAVDLGYAGNDYFLNVATIGLTTKIAQNLTVDMKRKFGRFVYAIAIFRALTKVKPFEVRIETENGISEFETLQIVLGNGRFHAGPFPLSPNASITEGKLTLYALATTNKVAFLKLATRLPTGHQGDLPEVRTQETAGGIITTIPSMPVTVDGEVCVHTPMKFCVAPKALRVMVPQDFAG